MEEEQEELVGQQAEKRQGGMQEHVQQHLQQHLQQQHRQQEAWQQCPPPRRA